MNITLSDARQYEVTFDVTDTCFRGLSRYDSDVDKQKERILSTFEKGSLFIHLRGENAYPHKVIMKSIGDIDMDDFEMTNRGTGLVMCDEDNIAICSLYADKEERKLFICSIYDTNCL